MAVLTWEPLNTSRIISTVLVIPFQKDQQQANYYCKLSNACKSEDSRDIKVIIHEQPELELPDHLYFNTGDIIQIDAGSGWQSYTWNTGSQNQILNISGLASGMYTYHVRVTDQNICPAYDTTHITVAILNGIPETAYISGIKIYPNPVNDILYLNSSNAVNEQISISITDNSGKIVLQMKIENMSVNVEYPIDISLLSPGAYYLKISNLELQKVEKLIIK